MKSNCLAVSVIIPILNCEEYIEKCLISLEKQTLENIEIICVDNGCEDQTCKIIKSYQKSDTRIKLIQEPKKGAGNARNTGLSVAKGKYIVFLDADDWFESNMLERAFKKSEQNELQICIWNVDEFDNVSQETISDVVHFRAELAPESSVFAAKDCKYLFNFTTGAPWNKMYLRDFAEQNQLSFLETESYNDLSMTYNALLVAERISYIDEVFTHYRVNNPKSLQGNRYNTIENLFTALNEIENKILCGTYENIIEISFVNFIISLFANLLRNTNDDEIISKIVEYLSLKKYFIGIKYIDIFSFYQNDWMTIKKYINKSKIKISVIVPTYNDQDTVATCLDSLRKQELDGLEFIIVDDASSDATVDVISKYAELDSRFTLIKHEKNMSAFQARKDGVLVSKGSYIMFADADDSLADEACDVLWNLLKNEHFDIIHFGTEVISAISDKKRLDGYKKLINPRDEKLYENDIFNSFVERNFEGHLWNKIFCADLAKYVLQNVENKVLPKGQDKYFYWMVAYYAKSYMGCPNLKLYNYYYGSGVEGKAAYGIKEFELFCKQAWTENAIEEFMINQNLNDKYDEALHKSRKNLLRHTVRQIDRLGIDERTQAINELHKYWNKEGDSAEIVTALCDFYKDKQEEITQFFTLDNIPKEKHIRTIGTYYHFFSNGGIQRVLAKLMEIWIKTGYEVVFFTDYAESPDDYELPEGVKRVTLSLNGNSAERNYGERGKSLEELIRENKVDVMVYHEYFGRSMLWDMMLCQLLDVPFIIYYHNTFSKFIATYEKQFYTIPKIAKMADGMVVLSDTDKRFWSAFNGNVSVIKNPLVFELNEIKQSKLKNNIIVWVGRLDELHKRFQEPIDMMKVLLKKVPDAKLMIVGRDADDRNYNRLKNRIAKLRMEDSVILCGFQKDVAPFYEMASVYLMTSNFEGYPMTLVEALSFGLPVVMYDIPYLTLQNGNKGITVVEQGKTEFLANAVEELLQNAELRKNQGKEARLFLENLYKKSDLGDDWKNIFSKLERSEKKNVERDILLETVVRHFEISYVNNMKKLNSYKNETKDFKYKSDDASLDIEQNELAQKYLDELLATRESITYKVGRFFTYIPRLVRHLIFKSPM